MKHILLLFFIFKIATIQSQSFENQLIKTCNVNDLKVLDKAIKKLELFNDTTTIYDVEALMNFEIIDDYRAYLYQIEEYNKQTITTYQIRVISKDNQIAFYEIEKGDNRNDKWIVKTPIAKKEEANLYKELNEKYQKIYGNSVSIQQIFDTSEIYVFFENMNGWVFESAYYRKRENYDEVIKNQDITTLLKWLKSGNISLQLYAIEGIFTLAEKGIIFPSDTWNFIELVQQKEGQTLYVKERFLGDELIYTLVHQIKAKHRKGKRIIKQNSKN